MGRFQDQFSRGKRLVINYGEGRGKLQNGRRGWGGGGAVKLYPYKRKKKGGGGGRKSFNHAEGWAQKLLG